MKKIMTFRVLAPVAGLAAALAWQGWGSAGAGSRAVGATAVHEETRTKIVPILTLGSGSRVGLAQVAGPVSRVDEVKAVAQIDTDYKDAARIRILVPIATEGIVSNLHRVPQVSITGEAGIKL